MTIATAANPVCVLDSAGYCARHKRRHAGVTMKHALDPGMVGSHHREQWDLQLAMREANQEMGQTDAAAVAVSTRVSGDRTVRVKKTPLQLVRPEKCQFLDGVKTGCRTCNRMMSPHHCEQGLPAVPGDYCQGCTSYKADEGANWFS